MRYPLTRLTRPRHPRENAVMRSENATLCRQNEDGAMGWLYENGDCIDPDACTQTSP